MKKKVIPECLKGEKRICLAITEPSAGSDVAGLTTTAVKTPDGKFYIVNGEKKWVFCPCEMGMANVRLRGDCIRII
jgi:alkylation response protein AidB-like acyl-CoA dehydrogenase